MVTRLAGLKVEKMAVTMAVKMETQKEGWKECLKADYLALS